jgi:hypothetical protein
MKKRWLLLGIILSGFLTGQAMASDPAGQPADAPPAAQGEQPAEANVTGGVSQIQQDIINKREQARLRRDNMLKVRAQSIKAEQLRDQERERSGER